MLCKSVPLQETALKGGNGHYLKVEWSTVQPQEKKEDPDGEPKFENAAILFMVLIIICMVSKITPQLELKRAPVASRESYSGAENDIYERVIDPFPSC